MNITCGNYLLIKWKFFLRYRRCSSCLGVQISITQNMNRSCVFFILVVGFIDATFIPFNFNQGFELWNSNRDAFLSKLTKINRCFTDNKANEIMRVINSRQCSAVGLPLEDAIRLEYDAWLSEDWFPNEQELASMKLDEVM